MKTSSLILLLCISLVQVLGCSRTDGQAEVAVEVVAVPIGLTECKACGMVVREQPAPRMQVVHRDGSHFHFCSVGDSVHYLADQSAHGKAVGVFVEVLRASEDPQIIDVDEHEWVEVEQAFYVTDVPRRGVMGSPVLVYRSKSEADDAAKRYEGTVKTWSEVKTVILHPEPNQSAAH